MTVDPATRRSTGLPLPALLIAPLGAAALAYVGDIVYGGDPWVVTFVRGAGVQLYAIVTGLFCAFEGLIVVPLYLRRRRYTHAAGMVAYLLAVAGIIFWLASFQTR
jgi:hypothetical protein